MTILDPWAEFLVGKEAQVTSQNGEDGILWALFERIGTQNKWCFEVGAGDGKTLSNTWSLREHGWSAVLIEADAEKFDLLCQCKPKGGGLAFVHERIGHDALDRILTSWRVPTRMDLGIIDIDGDDFAVWTHLQKHRPRVMLVEFNEGGDGPLWENGPFQAGFDSVRYLGISKGYLPIVRLPNNLLFLDCQEVLR